MSACRYQAFSIKLNIKINDLLFIDVQFIINAQNVSHIQINKKVDIKLRIIVLISTAEFHHSNTLNLLTTSVEIFQACTSLSVRHYVSKNNF